jgi:hypothetical protein
VKVYAATDFEPGAPVTLRFPASLCRLVALPDEAAG